MMARHGILAWIWLLLLQNYVRLSDGFSSGAPSNTCWTRYPKHGGRGTQDTKCPFLISLDPPNYRPGEEVRVTIDDPMGGTFSGFQIGAYRESSFSSQIDDTTTEVVGEFTALPEGVAAFSCFPGFKNMATHKQLGQAKSVTLTWTAPSYNAGNLTFRATIVADYERFWTAESKRLPLHSDVATPVKAPTFATPALSSIVQAVSFSECGSTKSCLYYPRHCAGEDCITAVSFQYRPSSKDYLVEMMSDAAENYVSVGFSDDMTMGGDETYSCVSQGGEMSIQHGLNPSYYNERLLLVDQFVSNPEIRHADGRLECRFTIQPVGQVYRINHSAPALDYKFMEFDRKQSWYLQVAWGKSMPESNVMTYHDNMPVTSDEKILVREAKIYRGSAFNIMVRVHVALMVVAWVFLSGIVTVVARHYRNWLGEKRICGTKVWFQVHRELAILIVVLTTIGLLLIFAHYEWEIRENAIPHAYVGLGVAGAVGVQFIAGMLRPGPDSKLRTVFNWGHRFLGQASHILAAVTMFLAFDIKYINDDMRRFGYIALGCWVAIQLLCHLIFEILSCRRNGKNSFTVSGSQKGGLPLESLLLAVYIIILAGLCATVMLAFLLF